MKEKLIVISGLLLVIISFTGWKLWKNYRTIDYDTVIYKVTNEYSREVEEVQWLHNKDWALVTWKGGRSSYNRRQIKDTSYRDNNTLPSLIGSKYVVEYEVKEKSLNGSNLENRGKENHTVFMSSKLIVYNNEEKLKKWKTIDLFEIAKEHKISAPAADPRGFSKDGEYVLFIAFDYEESPEDQYYYIHLESEEIFSEEEMEPTNIWKKADQKKTTLEYQFLTETNFARRDIVSESGLFPTMTYSEQEIEIRPAEQPYGVKPNLLEERYPEVKKQFEDNEHAVLYFFKNPPTGQELAELLVPADEEAFPTRGQSQVTMDSTGETVTSVADFIQKYEAYEAQD